MNDTVIKIQNLSKQYRLGLIGTGTLSHDLNRWWYRIRGKQDPYLMIGAVNDRTTQTSNGYVWALRNVNLEVKRGEVLGIIGKNGAGKSTLLKILSQVTGPTTGCVKVRGRIGSLLEVGTGFHPELTGRENIFLNGAILGMTKLEIRHKLDEIIEFSGTSKYIDTPVKRYSSGMKVRLAFAVAAHLDPEVMIVDEVLAVGDAEFQKKAIGKLDEVSKEGGRTVLFVSHNMTSIRMLCSSCCLIQDGEIQMKGNVNDCITSYLSMNRSSNSSGAKKYTNYSKGGICLHQVMILNEDKTISDQFSNHSKVFIQIDFELKEIIKNLKIGFKLENNDGAEILTSFHNDVNDLQFELGFNSVVAEVPARLLNKGRYYLTVMIGIHRLSWIFYEESILSISISFTTANKTMLSANRRSSLIAPLLGWKRAQ